MMNDPNYLAHYGISGMKWGVRRFQNEDGTLTPEGRIRYGHGKKSDQKVTEAAVRIQRRKSVGLAQKVASAAGRAAKNAGLKAKASIVKAAKTKKESMKARHKPVSTMTDQELRDTFNRLNMERSLKQVQNDLNGANKQKQSFGQKHPIIKQIAVTTAVGVASTLVTNQLRTKADEMLAPRRMKRAKEKGMLDKDLFPFVYNNQGRIIAYNNRQKEISDAAEKAAEEARKSAEEAAKKAHDAYVYKYSLASRKSAPHRVDLNFDSGSGTFRDVTSKRNRPKPGQTFLSKEAAARRAAAKEKILADSLKTSVSDLVIPGTANFNTIMDQLKIPRG